jgi:hypothetical protein
MPSTTQAPQSRPRSAAAVDPRRPAASGTGIGRTHARTHVVMLIQDLHVRVFNAATGELIRELTLDPARDYQPAGPG